MSPRIVRRRLLGGALVAVVVGGLVSVGAQSSSNTIYACVSDATGIVRVVAAGTECRPQEQAVQWNVMGPAGPQGPQGLPGERPPLSLTVDCSAGETIHDALEEAGDRAASVQITVAGMCDEDVILARSNTFLRGANPGDGFRSLLIGPLSGGWRFPGVSLVGLTLTGGLRARTGSSFSAYRLVVTGFPGSAIVVETGATGNVSQTTVNGCGDADWGCVRVEAGGSIVMAASQIVAAGLGGQAGVVAEGAVALTDTNISGFQAWGVQTRAGAVFSMSGGAVRDSNGGLIVTMGGVLYLRGVVVENNGWLGIGLDSGEADLEGCVVRGNGTGHGNDSGGIRGRTGAGLELQDTTVEGNHGEGIEMRDRSVVLMNRSLVTGNEGHGILLGTLSMLESSNAPNTVTNNAGWGLTCAPSARYRDYGAFAMSGNTQGDISASCIPE